MSALPTFAQIVARRSDVANYLTEGDTLEGVAASVLADVQRYLKNQRGIKWAMVYDADNSIYFKDTDGDANNDDQLKTAIAEATVSKVFRDYSISSGADADQWFDLAEYHELRWKELIDTAVLDVDRDESGSIEESEEAQTTQTFLRR